MAKNSVPTKGLLTRMSTDIHTSRKNMHANMDKPKQMRQFYRQQQKARPCKWHIGRHAKTLWFHQPDQWPNNTGHYCLCGQATSSNLDRIT